jgi:hypothetical protein
MAAATRLACRWVWPCLIAAAYFVASGRLASTQPPDLKEDVERRFEMQLKLVREAEARRAALLPDGVIQDRSQLRPDVFDDVAEDPIIKPAVVPPAKPGLITWQFRSLALGTQNPRSPESLAIQFSQVLETKVLAIQLVCGLTDVQKQKLTLAGQGDIQRLLDLIETQLAACRLLDERGAQEIPREAVEKALIASAAIESGPFNEHSIFSKTLNNSLTGRQRGDYDIYRKIERLGGKVHLRSRGNRDLLSIRMTDASFNNEGLVHFRKLTDLQGLILDYTQVSDSGLVHLADLTRLEILDLGGTGVTGSGLRHLRNLQHLQWLDLRRTPLTDTGVAELRPLTNLRSLHLEHTQITGAAFESLTNLTNLEILQLTQTRFNDAGLAHLRKFKNLKELSLEGTKITDEGVRHLAGLARLESLDLRRTAITDAGLADLAGLTHLQSLYLFGTQVTDDGVAKFNRSLPETRVIR